MIDWSQAVWRKSSRSSGEGQCVEVARVDDTIGVRDTKLGEASPVLEFTPDEWRAFIAGMKDGEFDV